MQPSTPKQHLNVKRLCQQFVLRSLWLLGCTIPLYYTTLSFALALDQTKVLELSANRADIDQQNHLGQYDGRVELDQGTTHLRAAKATTETDNHQQLIAAIAYGDKTQRAHYWTQTALDKPVLHAYAEIIRYYPAQHRIELEGHAEVTQGSDSLSAAKICYDTLKQRVITQNDKQLRTVITFHPKSSGQVGNIE